MQPHHFHHHLIRIGSTVKSTGPGTVIRSGFSLQQGLPIHFPLGVKLADPDFLFVRQTAGHRPGGDKNSR